MGALRPGYEVTSEITLLRRLGAGGMGTVWLATHRKLRTEVVVKFLSEQLASDAEACARFEREVMATLQVRSPHVVQTLDHGITDGGIPYLVMEWLEGNDLSKHMRAQKVLQPDEVQHIVEGLAAALTKAHERGIVHRDIKPANVFLVTASPRPFVKLVDFGIAKRLEDETMTATNALLGTPAYMSPEQMDGVPTLDHRTDLWALGVLTFHMLTGHAPFRGSHIARIAHAIMHDERPKISASRPDLPFALDAWIERALARNPGDRFASARELADTLALAFGELAYTTNRRRLRALPTGPHLPSNIVTRSLDQVGATLGPTAHTHSPDGTSPRLKGWVLALAMIGVVMIGLSFKVGYGLLPGTAASGAVSQPTFPPPPVIPSNPPSAPVASSATASSALSAPTTIEELPSKPPAPATRPVTNPTRRPIAPSPRPAVSSPRRNGAADSDDVGF